MIIDGEDKNAPDEEWVPQGDDEEDFGLEIIEEGEEEQEEQEKHLSKEKVAEQEKHDRVQQRIDQITAARYDEQRRAEAAEAKLAEMQQRIDRIESGVAGQHQDNFKEKYQSIKQRLYEAAEEGDTEKQVDLTEQLADMRAEAKLQEARAAARAAANKAAEKAPPAEQYAPRAAYEWWERNKWFNSPANAAESAYARQVDISLEQEGYDKNSPSYYEELDNRLQSRFPELYSDSSVENKRTPKPPTSPTGRRSTNRRSKNTARLTRDQLNMAKELGLTTPEELKAYALELQGGN